MLRDLLKDGGLYTLANMLTKGIGLLLIPFYSSYFTQAEYGILAMLGIVGAMSAALFSFQIYQGVGRFIAEADLTIKDKQKIGSTGFWFTFLSYTLFLVLGLYFQDSIIELLSEDERIKNSTFILSLVAIFLYGLFYTLSVQLKFLRMTKAYTLTTFLQSILNILLILCFAFVLDYRIDSIYMASLVITPIMIMMQIYFLKDYLILYLGKLELKKLLKFSSPLIPAAISYLILNFTDRIFIKEMTGALAEVGIYDMAFKFTSIVTIIIVSFQSALAPIIYEQHKNEGTKENLGRIFRLFLAVGSFGGLLLAYFSYETLYIFTQPNYYSASTLMPVFYLSILISGMGLFSPGLHIKGKTYLIALIVIASASVNIALNYYLIPIYGIFGAACATLVSTLFNNSILFIISQKLYTLVFPKSKTSLVLSVFIIVYVFGSYVDQFISLNYISLLGIKTLLLILYIWFLIRLDFINYRVVTNWIKTTIYAKKN
ncbi:MAG: oligosaccharide flippase family protein [Putridiphycobacter sp.]|nr:oligosaccharide flippase family protein [Putridiphycobacter sp.]